MRRSKHQSPDKHLVIQVKLLATGICHMPSFRRQVVGYWPLVDNEPRTDRWENNNAEDQYSTVLLVFDSMAIYKVLFINLNVR